MPISEHNGDVLLGFLLSMFGACNTVRICKIHRIVSPHWKPRDSQSLVALRSDEISTVGLMLAENVMRLMLSQHNFDVPSLLPRRGRIELLSDDYPGI